MIPGGAPVSATALLPLTCWLAGLLTGAVWPVAGLVILVAVVAVTPSLPWQLGLASRALPWLYLVGWLAGHGALLLARRSRQKGTSGRHENLRLLAWITVALGLPPVLLGLARNFPLRSFYPAILLEDLARLRPGGPAEMIQDATTFLAGPLLLLICLRMLARSRNRRRLLGGLLAGGVAIVSGPWVQRAFLDPSVRPDWGTSFTNGQVGLFQDPSSFAAALVLVIGLAAGMALHRRGGPAWIGGGLAFAAIVALSMARSRAAVVAAGVALLSPLALRWLRERGTGRLVTRGLTVGAACLLAISVAGGALGDQLLPALDALEHSPVRWVPGGADDPRRGPSGAAIQRVHLWRKAGTIAALHPLWGVGASRVPGADIRLTDASGAPVHPASLADNSHQHYLQAAAELGIPFVLAWSAMLLVACRRLLERGPGRAGGRGIIAGLAAGSLAGVLGVLLMGLLAHPLRLPEIQALFFVVLGLALAGPRST